MSKDNIYIQELLCNYFATRRYQEVQTDTENVFMFGTYQNSYLYLINLIVLNQNYSFDYERYLKYREITKNQFKANPADKIILLNILITETPNQVYDTINMTPDIEEEFVDIHWIINSLDRELIIPKKQLRSVMDLEKSIRKLVTTGAQSVFQLDKEKYPSHITMLLISINILVWIFLEYNGGSSDFRVLLKYGAINVEWIQATGQYYRFITSMFIHIGFAHLAFNTFSLYIFGSRLEKYIKVWQYLIIYFVAGLFGSLSSYFGSLFLGTNVIAAGASGAIYGLLGSILVLSNASKEPLEGLNAYMMWILFIFGIVYSVLSPNVDAFAHIGGFVGGLASAVPIVYFNKRQLGGWTDEKG